MTPPIKQCSFSKTKIQGERNKIRDGIHGIAMMIDAYEHDPSSYFDISFHTYGEWDRNQCFSASLYGMDEVNNVIITALKNYLKDLEGQERILSEFLKPD